MNGSRFDRISRSLATSASRRRLLAGLGAVTAGGLLGGTVAAAPSPKAACMKACNQEAKAARIATCKGLTSREKRDCLKTVKEARAACRQACHAPVEEPPVEEPVEE